MNDETSVRQDQSVDMEAPPDAVDDAAAAERALAEAEDAELPAEEELSLEEQLAAAQAKAAEYLDGWQRARAEYANARKRLEKSRADARRNATVDVLARLLPIIDDLDRALANVPERVAEDNWFEGLALVERKLRGLLDSAQIERIESVGQEFDPNFHEAVLTEASEEVESGVVVRELQPGYKLGERVLRPSMVVVAS